MLWVPTRGRRYRRLWLPRRADVLVQHADGRLSVGSAARHLSARTRGLVQAGLLAAPLAYWAVRLAGSHIGDCIVAAPHALRN